MKVSLVVTALKIPSNNSLCVNKPGLMIFNIKHLKPLSYSVKNTLTLYSVHLLIVGLVLQLKVIMV